MLSTFDISLENRDGIKLKRWINTKFHNNGAQTRYSRYLSPSRSNWSGIKFKKIFTTKLIFSINCEKKSWHFHSFSPASSTDIRRRKDSLRSWYRFPRTTRVKLNFSEETTRKWRRGWVGETPFFFYRIKVDASRFRPAAAMASSHPEKLKL